MRERKQKAISKSLRLKIIKRGGRIRGENIFFEVLREIKKREKRSPINVIVESIEKISPKVTVMSKKVGGSRYQIPIPIKENKEYSIAISWLLDVIRKVKRGNLKTKIIKEIELAKKKEGEIIKKRNALHKIAISNIAFLKFIG